MYLSNIIVENQLGIIRTLAIKFIKYLNFKIKIKFRIVQINQE